MFIKCLLKQIQNIVNSQLSDIHKTRGMSVNRNRLVIEHIYLSYGIYMSGKLK